MCRLLPIICPVTSYLVVLHFLKIKTFFTVLYILVQSQDTEYKTLAFCQTLTADKSPNTWPRTLIYMPRCWKSCVEHLWCN